jgi:hypothetical protein
MARSIAFMVRVNDMFSKESTVCFLPRLDKSCNHQQMVDWKSLHNFEERLSYAFTRGKLSRSDFAQELEAKSGKAGTQQLITNWISRGKIGSPSMRIFQALTGISAMWVNTGDGAPTLKQEMFALEQEAVQRLQENRGREPISNDDEMQDYLLPAPRKVQVTGVASVNEQGFIDQVSDDSDGNGYFLVDVEDRDAYYLKLRGTGSEFAVQHGWYVLLAPNSKPEPSEKAIAKLADGRWFMGAFERHDGGEYVLRRPDGRLAVFAESEVEYLHPIHGTMSPRQLRRA